MRIVSMGRTTKSSLAQPITNSSEPLQSCIAPSRQGRRVESAARWSTGAARLAHDDCEKE